MIKEGKYIYCIIKEREDKRIGSIGINNQEINLVKSAKGGAAKLQFNGVNLVHYKNIAAVVSNTLIINFDRLDKEELTRHVILHQKVNEEVMKDYDICPMTFGIIAPSVDEVLRILERAYLQFKTALKKIEGKAEFAVQVWWDQRKLLEELANTNPEIQKLKQAYSRLRRDGPYRAGLSSHRPSESKIQNREMSLKAGVLGMPIKLRLGKLIFQEVEAHREAFIKDIQASLNNLAHDSTQNKLIEDEMIANFSFLIGRAREPELDKKMQGLGKKYEGKLRFKYIGPMPPYSFVNINLSLGNFEVVNEARKLLGLGEEATLDEIKKAYYSLSHQYHPDKSQGDEEKMKKITQSYSILENYCQSCDEIVPERSQTSQKYSFKKEDVENSILIK